MTLKMVASTTPLIPTTKCKELAAKVSLTVFFCDASDLKYAIFLLIIIHVHMCYATTNERCTAHQSRVCIDFSAYAVLYVWPPMIY